MKTFLRKIAFVACLLGFAMAIVTSAEARTGTPPGGGGGGINSNP